MITHALILSAGRGERMRPLTDTTPKPLLRAGGKHLIEWQIAALAAAGVRQIVVNTAHLPDQFDPALGDGQRYGVALTCVREGEYAEDALETLGGIVNALPKLGNTPFIVTSGDVVTDYPYQRLTAISEGLHRGDADAHLVLVENPPFHVRGDMALINGRIDPDAAPRLTYANIGVFAPRLFGAVSARRAALFPWLYDAARERRVSGEIYSGQWWNAGTPEDLAQLDAELNRIAAAEAVRSLSR